MKNKVNWLEAILLLAPLLILVVFWRDLPARVPIHWKLRGEIDGWAPSAFGMLVMPLTGLGTIALLHVLPRFDPKLRRTVGGHGRMDDVLQIMRVVLAAFLARCFACRLRRLWGTPSASAESFLRVPFSSWPLSETISPICGRITLPAFGPLGR